MVKVVSGVYARAKSDVRYGVGIEWEEENALDLPYPGSLEVRPRPCTQRPFDNDLRWLDHTRSRQGGDWRLTRCSCAVSGQSAQFVPCWIGANPKVPPLRLGSAPIASLCVPLARIVG